MLRDSKTMLRKSHDRARVLQLFLSYESHTLYHNYYMSKYLNIMLSWRLNAYLVAMRIFPAMTRTLGGHRRPWSHIPSKTSKTCRSTRGLHARLALSSLEAHSVLYREQQA